MIKVTNKSSFLIFTTCLILNVVSAADSTQTISKELQARPDFFSKMDVLENFKILETSSDSDLKVAGVVADLLEVSGLEDMKAHKEQIDERANRTLNTAFSIMHV